MFQRITVCRLRAKMAGVRTSRKDLFAIVTQATQVLYTSLIMTDGISRKYNIQIINIAVQVNSVTGILQKQIEYIVRIQVYGIILEADRSCTRGMIRTRIHIICPGCPRPSIALQCRIVA